MRFDRDPLPAVHDSQDVGGEGVPEDGGVLQQRPLFGRQRIEARGDERLQGLGDLERAELARDVIDTVVLGEHAPPDEHPHGLDGIERNSL